MQKLGFTGLVLAAFSLAACVPYGTEVDQVRKAVETEKKSYESLVSVQGKRGDFASLAVLNWSRELSDLADQADDLTNDLDNGRSEKETKLLAQLKPFFDELLARKVEFSLRIPEWRSNSVPAAIQSIQSARSRLVATYLRLYPETIVHSQPWEMTVAGIDTGLKDTYPECWRMFEDLRLSRVESGCSEAAFYSCEHQLDLQCVREVIVYWAIQNNQPCMVTTESVTDSCAGDGTCLPTKSTDTHRANWTYQIAGCRSREAVLK